MFSLEKLITDGFLLLEIPSDVQEQIRTTFDVAYPFFHGTEDEKNLNRLQNDLGYRPYGIEYSKPSSQFDQVESFSVRAGVPDLISGLHSAAAKALCEQMLATFNTLAAIAEVVTVELASALSDSAICERISGAFHRWSLLQLNYSRPADVSLPYINEAHEDGALVTVAYANGPGLELQVANGRFLPMTNAQDSVLVLPGEIMWLLSGGRVRPLHHRVRPEPECRERMSLLFFGDIDPGLCEPWVLNDINRNVDIGARVLTNPTRYGLKKWTLD